MYSSFVKHWRHILWAAIALSVALPFIHPLGLPIKIGTETKSSYEAINNLPEDSIVVMILSYQSGNWPECGPIETSFLSHLAKRPLRTVILSINTESAELTRTRIFPIIDWGNKEYGVDWVYLGFLAGEETGLKSFADNVWDTLHTDFYGTSFENLPIMEDLKTGSDIKLIINIHSLYAEPVIRQFNTPYGTRILVGTQIGNIVTQKPYLESGQLQGAVFGIRGAAEYDSLIGRKTDVIISMDSLTLSHIVAITAIILGNITYFMEGKKSRM